MQRHFYSAKVAGAASLKFNTVSLGMTAAALGFLTPLQGAIGQEVIDLLAVFNAVRASIPMRELRDF